MARPDEHLPGDKIWTAQLFWIDGSGERSQGFCRLSGERDSRIEEVTIDTDQGHCSLSHWHRASLNIRVSLITPHTNDLHGEITTSTDLSLPGIRLPSTSIDFDTTARLLYLCEVRHYYLPKTALSLA
jgi:hypothetical protein